MVAIPEPEGRGRAAREAVAASRAGPTREGAIPTRAQQAAMSDMGTSMERGASWASGRAAERRSPRKTVPKTFTKQARARAPIAARAGTPTAPTMAGPPPAITVRKRPR